MTQPITIGISKNPTALIDRLDNELKMLKTEGIQLKYKVNHKGNITFLGCNSFNESIGEFDFKFFLANIITDIIIDDWVHFLVKRIIRTHYYFFNEIEKKKIKEKALELLQNDEINYYPLSRRNSIQEKVLEYLEKNEEIVLDGFVNFRLKDYVLEIEEVVDAAADFFLEEKEYMEFIRLLKYFVDIQEPKVKEVHIIWENNDTFRLVDKEGKELKNEYLDGFAIDLLNNINYEDLLISALITLAPSKVVMHTKQKTIADSATKTIENVFGNKLVYCNGCKMCRNNKNI